MEQRNLQCLIPSKNPSLFGLLFLTNLVLIGWVAIKLSLSSTIKGQLQSHITHNFPCIEHKFGNLKNNSWRRHKIFFFFFLSQVANLVCAYIYIYIYIYIFFFKTVLMTFFFFLVVRSLTISKETCIKFISSIRRTIITTTDCTKFYQSIRILVEYLPSAFFSFFFFFF